MYARLSYFRYPSRGYVSIRVLLSALDCRLLIPCFFLAETVFAAQTSPFRQTPPLFEDTCSLRKIGCPNHVGRKICADGKFAVGIYLNWELVRAGDGWHGSPGIRGMAYKATYERAHLWGARNCAFSSQQL